MCECEREVARVKNEQLEHVNGTPDGRDNAVRVTEYNSSSIRSLLLLQELKESFNYGLFAPPSNGKAGKFLDEERRLGDYPFNGPVGYLEVSCIHQAYMYIMDSTDPNFSSSLCCPLQLKYKRRVYKMLTLDERQLKALHTRANLRRFLDCINGGHVEKIAKMCAKGLDPNFHCSESGETPLSVATGAKKPNKLLIALVNGGALLDYRTKDGTTALHRAVEHDSLEAVRWVSTQFKFDSIIFDLILIHIQFLQHAPGAWRLAQLS